MSPDGSLEQGLGGRLRRLAWLPIPILLLTMAALWVADLRSTYESPHLMMFLNFVTRTLASVLIIYLAGRSFLSVGSPGLLLLGCGVTIWGASGFIASTVGTDDANFGVTVTNLGAWLSALCHLAGASVSLHSKTTVRSKVLWLCAGYMAALIMAELVAMASLAGDLPVFFVQGHGGTLVRYIVLSSAVFMFALTAVLLWELNRSLSSAFVSWYALALMMIAAGLLGMMIQSTRNSPLDWTCRVTQYLGAAYMLVAAVASRGGGGLRQTQPARDSSQRQYQYGVAIAVVLAAAAMRLTLFPTLGGRLAFVTFYPAVMLAALYGGLRAGLLAAVLSAVVAHCLWSEPRGFIDGASSNWLATAMFLATCSMITGITEAMRRAQMRATLAEIEARLAEERVRTAEALRRKESELDEARRVAHIGSWHWDARTDVTMESDELLRIFGFDPATQLMPTFSEQRGLCYPEEDWDRVNTAVRRALDTGIGYELDARALRSGEPIWITTRGEVIRNAGGQIVGMRGTVQDITERKRAEEDIRQNRQRLAWVLDTTGIGLWLNEWPLAHLNWDNRARELFFIPADAEPTLELFFEHVHADDRQSTLSAIETAVRDRTLYCIEHRAVNPATGEIRWIRSTGQAVYAEDGTPIRFDGINYDITDRKRAEEAIRRANEQLREADRRKDEFVAMLAHELRNPLSPVRIAVEIMRLAGPTDPVLARQREVIERQIGHMTHLLDDLLDVSRITRGKIELKPRPIHLTDVLIHAVETAKPLIDAHGHLFDVVQPPDPLSVEADPHRLAQAVANLLVNAAKFTDDGGHIWLMIARAGSEAVIRVRDTGPGIAPDMLPHVFDLFTQADHTLDRSRGGLGIGLTMAKNLVEMHGGRVEAWSEGLGLGSEFVIHLPLLSDGVERPINPEQSAQHSPETKLRRILVVDDVQDSADNLAQMLHLSGHDVRATHNGPEALSVALDFQPEVVLLDIGMPGMDGYEVARRLRVDHGDRLVLVALTGYAQATDRQDAQKAGFDHHLAKPLDLDALYRLLSETALSGHDGHEQCGPTPATTTTATAS